MIDAAIRANEMILQWSPFYRWGMRYLALLEGWPVLRGIYIALKEIINGVFSEIVVL